IPGSDNAVIMLVVDDTRRAVEAIKERDFGSIEENDVIMLELDNKPGALKTITGLLAYKGVNIRYIYATTSRDTWYVKVILSTSENGKAFITLRESVAK
ncbi:MAG: ACT domain-containing protein, partial [Smithella sp.]